MLKKFATTTSFSVACFFVFSLLSNCYCAPVTPVPIAQPVASHCEHHSDPTKAKDADCSPRFHTNDIESLLSQIKPVKQVERAFSAKDATEIFYDSKQSVIPSFNFEVRPSLDSSPPIYILVRSLLI